MTESNGSAPQKESGKAKASEGGGLEAPRKLKWAQVWDVVSPPPANSIKGHIVPKPFSSGRRRRISIEVYTVQPLLHSKDKKDVKAEKGMLQTLTGAVSTAQPGTEPQNQEFEECWIRVWQPKTSQARKTLNKNAKAVTKALKMQKKGDKKGKEENGDEGYEVLFEDEASVAGTASILGIDDTLDPVHLPSIPNSKEFKAKYKLAIKDVTVNKRAKNVVVVTTSFKKFKQTRELIFQIEDDAVSFVQTMRQQQSLEEGRSKQKLQAALGGITLMPKEQISLLIEICSAWDLPAADLFSSDPFVSIVFNGQELHKTKHETKKLDVVFTLKTDSLFLLNMSARDFFSVEEGVMFVVKDFDTFGANDVLGVVIVPPKMLYTCNGERMVFDLQNPNPKEPSKGKLAIRCRHATDNDQRFMANYAKDQKQAEGDASEKQSGGKGNVRSMISKQSKVEKKGPDEGARKYLVRPFPDPKREEETKWMTERDIESETMKESNHWFDMGSGDLGRIFVEILACDDLPNLDAGGFLGNKTDTFISLVYEDSVVRTDVIDDCLAPRWLPWSKRAFIFHMLHGSSQLFLGAFDFDGGVVDDHDLIGRVAVDLSNMRPDTEYVLCYPLYDTAQMSKRKENGTIKIRLRIELEDERNLILTQVKPPPSIYVNVKKKRDFRVVRYTCTGMYDMEKFSIETITQYVEELESYKHLAYYVEDALMTLLLWRSTASFSIPLPDFKKSEEEKSAARNVFEKYTKSQTVAFPIHSLTAFLAMVILVERPGLFPSFSFAAIAWGMIAITEYRRNSPNPWARSKGFLEMFNMLVLGSSMTTPHDIKPDENKEAAEEFQQQWTKRVKDAEEAAAKAAAEALKRQEEQLKEQEEIGEAEVDISTKGGGVSINPLIAFKPILYPIQQALGTVCNGIRFTRNVIIWEENYFSFWVTLGSFVLAFCCLFVPWAFLIKWTTRIVVWTLFGPWMKAVDVYYVSKLKPLSEEEEREKKAKESETRKEATELAAKNARIKREDATKLKVMKKYRFGKFISKVPILKMDRFPDIPLPNSSATPYKPKPVTIAELAMEEAGRNRTRIPGQQLVGDMIPTIEMPGKTDAPVGQAAKHRELLQKGALGANKGIESDTAAYAKIGSVVIVAGLVTWFGVPVLATTIKWIFQGKFLSLWS